MISNALFIAACERLTPSVDAMMLDPVEMVLD